MKLKKAIMGLGLAVAAGVIVKKLTERAAETDLLPSSYGFDPDPTASAVLASYRTSTSGKISGAKQSKNLTQYAEPAVLPYPEGAFA